MRAPVGSELGALVGLRTEVDRLPLAWGEEAMRRVVDGLVAMTGSRSGCFTCFRPDGEPAVWPAGAGPAGDAVGPPWWPAVAVRTGSYPERDGRAIEAFLSTGHFRDDPRAWIMAPHMRTGRVFIGADFAHLASRELAAETRALMATRGVADSATALLPMAEDRTAAMTVSRGPGGRPFGERERALMSMAAQLFAGTAHATARFFGFIGASAHLTPRERDVLSGLLTGKTEEQVADHLGMGRRSMHKRVVSLYRKFGVRSRAGLMALWLCGGPAPPRR